MTIIIENASQTALVVWSSIWVIAFFAQAFSFSTKYKLGASWTKAPLRGRMWLVVILFGDLGILIYMFLDDSQECTREVAYASTISRISASIHPECYVFMMVSLIILAMTFKGQMELVKENRKDNFVPESDMPWVFPTVSEQMIIIGFAMTTLTAVLPDFASNSALVAFEDRAVHISILSRIHIIGIIGGIVLSCVGCMLRTFFSLMIIPRTEHEGLRDIVRKQRSIRYELSIITLGTIALIYCALTFMLSPVHDAPAAYICTLYETKEMCEGAAFAARTGTEELFANWPCVWNPSVSLTHRACSNPTCDPYLPGNSQHLVFEYLTLLYWVLICSWCLMLIENVEVDMKYGNPFKATHSNMQQDEIAYQLATLMDADLNVRGLVP